VPDWVRTKTMWSEHASREIEYFVCDEVDALVYVANLATIPLHIWGSRLSSLQHPDWCILDLDPKGAPFLDVVKIARYIHDLCEEIDLPTYCKTSGSSGLHVLIPLGRKFTFEQCRMLAEVLARQTASTLRDIATVERHVPKRKGKVYIDFLQNGHGRLLASPWCVRPLPGAPVSTPLRWDEVDPSLDPRTFTIKTVPDRVASLGEDPMRPVLTDEPDLPTALQRLLARLDP
jgi:bifunctional non-homologous end joining protein LigD